MRYFTQVAPIRGLSAVQVEVPISYRRGEREREEFAVAFVSAVGKYMCDWEYGGEEEIVDM